MTKISKASAIAVAKSVGQMSADKRARVTKRVAAVVRGHVTLSRDDERALVAAIVDAVISPT